MLCPRRTFDAVEDSVEPRRSELRIKPTSFGSYVLPMAAVSGWMNVCFVLDLAGGRHILSFGNRRPSISVRSSLI